MSIALRLGVSNIHRSMSSMAGVVEGTIRTKLDLLLEAKYLDVINESYMHNVPKGAETHFKVVVVSEKFDGLPLIKRHRLVNDILKDELQTGVHALSIVAKTPKQWEESDKVVESSPNCKGGFGKYSKGILPATNGQCYYTTAELVVLASKILTLLILFESAVV